MRPVTVKLGLDGVVALPVSSLRFKLVHAFKPKGAFVYVVVKGHPRVRAEKGPAFMLEDVLVSGGVRLKRRSVDVGDRVLVYLTRSLPYGALSVVAAKPRGVDTASWTPADPVDGSTGFLAFARQGMVWRVTWQRPEWFVDARAGPPCLPVDGSFKVLAVTRYAYLFAYKPGAVVVNERGKRFAVRATRLGTAFRPL